MKNLSKNFSAWLWPLCLLGVGLYFLHVPMLRDEANFIHGDLGDSRLISLLLEHSYRYLFRLDPGMSYWSPPWIYFPAKNGLAYSDVMTGGVFLYAPWRLLGIAPLDAYQLWFVATSTANFAAFMLLARFLGFSVIGSAVGSYVISFGMTNVAFSNHPQMLSHYYLLLTVYFMLRVLRETDATKRLWLSGLAALTYALQFWTAFYPAWFFTLIVGFGVFFAFFRRWQQLRTDFKVYVYPALVFVSVAAVLIFPLIRRYLIIKNLMGERVWREVAYYLPTWQAYLMPTAESVFYRNNFFKFSDVFKYPSELCLFSGIIVLFAPFLYAVTSRLDPAGKNRLFLQTVSFSFLSIFLLTFKWGPLEESFSLWKLVFDFVPGGGAIRAVGRIALMLQILAGLLLACCISRIQSRFGWGWLVGIAIGLGVAAENAVEHNYMFSKKEHYQRLAGLRQAIQDVGHDCRIFHRSYLPDGFPFREIDAMLVSQQLAIPTSNGYSGGMPPAYWNSDIFRSQSIEKITDWFNMNNHPIEQNKLCFLP